MRVKHEKMEIETNLKLKEEKLETLEKKYKDLMEENLVASNQKDEVSKVREIFERYLYWREGRINCECLTPTLTFRPP